MYNQQFGKMLNHCDIDLGVTVIAGQTYMFWEDVGKKEGAVNNVKSYFNNTCKIRTIKCR